MDIEATRDFKHGKQAFQAGHAYEVPDGPGYYFVANGWARSVARAAGAPAPIKVDADLLNPDARPAPALADPSRPAVVQPKGAVHASTTTKA